MVARRVQVFQAVPQAGDELRRVVGERLGGAIDVVRRAADRRDDGFGLGDPGVHFLDRLLGLIDQQGGDADRLDEVAAAVLEVLDRRGHALAVLGIEDLVGALGRLPHGREGPRQFRAVGLNQFAQVVGHGADGLQQLDDLLQHRADVHRRILRVFGLAEEVLHLDVRLPQLGDELAAAAGQPGDLVHGPLDLRHGGLEPGDRVDHAGDALLGVRQGVRRVLQERPGVQRRHADDLGVRVVSLAALGDGDELLALGHEVERRVAVQQPPRDDRLLGLPRRVLGVEFEADADQPARLVEIDAGHLADAHAGLADRRADGQAGGLGEGDRVPAPLGEDRRRAAEQHDQPGQRRQAGGGEQAESEAGGAFGHVITPASGIGCRV